MKPSGWYETDDELYYVASDGTVYLHTTPDAGHRETLPKLPAGAWQCNPRHIDPDWHDWAGEIERKARCTAQEATIRELSEALEALCEESSLSCGCGDEKGCRFCRAHAVLKRTRGAS